MDNNIARILLDTNEEHKKYAQSLSRKHIMFPELVIDLFAGPAILTNGSLDILHQNIGAESLAHAISQNDPALKSIIIRCLNNASPESQKITFKDQAGTHFYDFYAFPVSSIKKGDDARVLLFGKDTTVEQNLTKALVDSRQMFKDLVSCSSDFAWETDGSGCFNYVSPEGILGYTAYELNGKSARDLIVGSDGKNPFDTLDVVKEMELWLQRSDGSKACVLISAVPIIDNNSSWLGARGVCRDITDQREREATLRRVRKREQILNRIVASIRDKLTPDEILDTTVRATMEAIRAKHCSIIQLSRESNGRLKADLKAQNGAICDSDIFYSLCQRTIRLTEEAEQDVSRKAFSETIGNYEVLIGVPHHHNKINGGFFLFREKTDTGWSEEELMLFNGITNHLAIALEQIRNHEDLRRLSRTDELTGLLNRRAFKEEVKKRISNQKRSRQDCAILYIDLDNFKNVNDTKGHAKGDAILRKVSEIIHLNIRVGDHAARLGGDEFAIWLENANQDEAIKKAKIIINASKQLERIAGDISPQISLSIGIAISQSEQISKLDDLLEQADKALYEVKNNGKSGYAILDLPNTQKAQGK